MPNDYTEDQLVEQPALELLQALGWTTVCAANEALGEDSTLGRTTKAEVVLAKFLRPALEKLNPKLPKSAIDSAVDHLTQDRGGMTLVGANREVYALLKDGVLVSVPDEVHGGQTQERVRVIDWERPMENRLLAVSQLKVQGPMYACIPDVVLFVNGLPLVVMEFKKPGINDRVAFDDNLRSYKHPLNGVPALFAYNAALITSNGTESHIGSLTSDWERFFEWKRVESEDEPRMVSLEVMLRGTCEPGRLLDLVENFTLFSELSVGTVKILGQNHQFLGVNNAIEKSMEARRLESGQGGVFWHTQGSGKSFSMVFYAQKILRKHPGNWTFVVITDRVELDDQIAKTFKACGAVSDAESKECHAASGAHLRELLAGNHRYVFTLIHKFQIAEELCDRRDVIVLVDEAHRSQYDTLAMNMRAALPYATFVAFTGTPLIAGEERTREIFGDYVSIYDFQQSVEDGATVPLFYENRTPELKLTNPNLNDDIYDVVESAGLDEDAEDRLEKLLGKQYHLITRDDRLETIAEDVVRHFLGRGFLGKAMVVAIDKATAIRMYDKVRAHWAKEHRKTHNRLLDERLSPEKEAELRERLRVLETTDMAVIVSAEQNEIENMKAKGLNILPHRERMNKEPLDEKFRDSDDRLRIAFVCAMWLTGFDAPSCSTVYLDKPMRNHTLMQTIARANRVYPGKHSGVIVDYANVFVSLEKALAIYGAGSGGTARPVQDKEKLAEELREAVDDASAFCGSHGVSLSEIEKSSGLTRLALIDDAVNALISPEALRKEFLAHARLVDALYRAVKPHPAAIEFMNRATCLGMLSDVIKQKLNPKPMDLRDVLASIDKVLDDSITGVSIGVREVPKINLSKIDFQALKKKFEQSKHQNTELEELKAAIRAQLDRMIAINKTRVDFLEKFEALIDHYNSGAATIEDLFTQLVELTKGLSAEQQRHVRESLSEEELVVFDILTRPAPELTDAERAEVKKVSRDMLAKLKSLMVVDWRKRRAAISKVQIAIQDTLDAGLPQKYDPALYNSKCTAVFDHFYEKYPQAHANVYT
jgi:type I restriction enzyme R subunit